VRFFHSRSQSAAQAAAVRKFWSWWQSTGARLATMALADGESERLAEPMARHLAAIHPGLTWQVDCDPDSLPAVNPDPRHILVVSGDGDPALQAIASRWRQAAPAANEIWAYSEYRSPAIDPAATVLDLGSAKIDVTSATVSADVRGAHVDVTMYHPRFAEIPAEQHMSAAFRLLDTVLGEAAVDSWLGTVEAAVEPPSDPVPLTALRTVVDELEAEFTDVEGERSWLLTRATSDDGAPILASAQVPLRPSGAARLDTHVDVSVCFSEWTQGGLPARGSLQRLRDFQDLLNNRLGDTGRVVAHETQRGVRTLHLYVDSTTFALKQLRGTIAGWSQGTVSVTENPDPTWESVQHLRS
jgi:hypothetical protein